MNTTKYIVVVNNIPDYRAFSDYASAEACAIDLYERFAKVTIIIRVGERAVDRVKIFSHAPVKLQLI